MAVRRLTIKNIISRVRQVFPQASETYLINLINDALLEAGMYRTKVEYAKATTVADQMDFMDSAGDYIKVPRLIDNEILKMDVT